MQKPNYDTETCPCRVCRSDMAYVHPFCESPIIIVPMMVVSEPNQKETINVQAK